MENKIYKRKVVDDIIKYLETDNVVVLHGARQVGKTHILYWLKEYLEKNGSSTYYIDLEDSRMTKMIDLGVQEFIAHLKEEGLRAHGKNKVYVFIDEIQYLNNPSEFLKLIADHHKNIKLIVSGSSSFEIKSKFKDSLVGRTVNFEIFNLSFEEFLLFKEYYFDKSQKITEMKTNELKSLFKSYVLYGGYPKIALTEEIDLKSKYLQQIIDTYVKKDIRDLAQVKDIEKFNKLTEVLASQSGQMLNIAELSNTCRIAKQTIEKYLFILENTYIIKLVKPFYKNIRSELFKTPKVFFYDSGLVQMLWLRTLQKEIIGPVFETSVYGELVKKYGRENIYYWRTKDKKEIDFILKDKERITPIEVKINFGKAHLRNIKYFTENYQNDKFYVVGLEGEKKGENILYPWEL
ncbi:MAG: ATP-binding protein [Desulfobacterales bacterium]|nr:ATP-binding protein [Desulfobacterales bacterium]